MLYINYCIICIIYTLICLSLGASNSVSVLRREVAKLKMLLKDRENVIKNKEGQIAALKESLCKAQEKHEEKTKASFNDFIIYTYMYICDIPFTLDY